LRGFLSDLERLEMLHEESKGWEQMGAAASSDPAAVRNQKLARFRASKAAKERLAILASKQSKRHGNDDDDDDDGDDDERESALLNIRCCCHVAIDSIRASEQELDMLLQIAKMRRADGSLPPAPTPSEDDPSQGLQMLSLVPDPRRAPPAAPPPGGLSALVSGSNGVVSSGVPSVLEGFRQTNPMSDATSRLSYATAMRQIHTGDIPGLYSFSVEEGLRREEAERAMAEAKRMDQMGERAEQRQRDKEEKAFGNDDEDEDERQKLMKQDEFRDWHKRGAGNRKNRS